jgi:hypothetical protein
VEDPASCDVEKRREYIEERKSLIDAEREAARSFDKAMITLSSGGLALSIAFVGQASPTGVELGYFLFASWIFFSLALLTITASFLMSQSALRAQREIIDQEYSQKCSDNGSGRKNRYATYTGCLNWLAIGFFALGVLSLVTFTIRNFGT